MENTITPRSANAKGQFILPAIPRTISPELAATIADYRDGFRSDHDDAAARWDSAAAAVMAFQPRSTADLAAKLIISIHYRDPECDGEHLAIDASEHIADRRAAEMELACVDHLLAAVAEQPENAAEWAAAEADLAAAQAALDALPEPYSDEDVDRLTDVWSDAIHALLEVPAATSGQAFRKLDLGMFDTHMVRSGVDYAGLLAEAKLLVGEGR